MERMFFMSEMMQPPVNFREEFLKFLHHEPTVWTPVQLACSAVAGFGALPGPWIEKGPIGGGYDGFGVRWITPASGGGAPIPAPNEFILEDICDWREVIKFPNLDEFDWAADAAIYVGNVDRTQQVVDFGIGNGVFERLAAFMGFEEALCAMVTDPEEVYALMDALTDWKIDFAKKVKQYYNPDTITYYDDVATERDLFMSPETYRTLIKPHHKRFAQACLDMDILPIYHCCGKAEAIVEDMIDCGWVVWTSVQPSNDICGLIEKYGDRFGFIGGYDSNGKPARINATLEEMHNEVHRCLDTYGKYGKGYAFFGFRYFNSLDPNAMMQAMAPIVEEAMKYSFQLLFTKMAQQG